MEAMACGVPVVGFNSGGIPEMIDHRINGYVARRRDSSDLTEGLQYVLDHPEFGAAAREKVMQNYQPNRIANQYRDLYLSLLSKL